MFSLKQKSALTEVTRWLNNCKADKNSVIVLKNNIRELDH